MTSGASSRSSERRASQRSQRASRKLPWSSSTFLDPARTCSESTFCVASVKSSKRPSSSASATCAAFGRARRCAARRSLYHVQTSDGLRANPSGDASSSTRCVRHKPFAPRNVGRPLSDEIPEPVSTHRDEARASRSLTSRGISITPLFVLVRRTSCARRATADASLHARRAAVAVADRRFENTRRYLPPHPREPRSPIS
jgi:hypothetical protein